MVLLEKPRGLYCDFPKETCQRLPTFPLSAINTAHTCCKIFWKSELRKPLSNEGQLKQAVAWIKSRVWPCSLLTTLNGFRSPEQILLTGKYVSEKST